MLTPATLLFHASAQGIHQIDNFRWRPLPRCFDLLTRLLFLQQLLQRILVVVLKFLGLKCPDLVLYLPTPRRLRLRRRRKGG